LFYSSFTIVSKIDSLLKIFFHPIRLYNVDGHFERFRCILERRSRLGNGDELETGAQVSRRKHVHPEIRGYGCTRHQPIVSGEVFDGHKRLRDTKDRRDRRANKYASAVHRT